MKNINILLLLFLFPSTYTSAAPNKKNSKQSSTAKKTASKPKADLLQATGSLTQDELENLRTPLIPETKSKKQPAKQTVKSKAQEPAKKVATQKKAAQPTKQKSTPSQSTISKQSSTTWPLLSQSVPFVKKSTSPNMDPGADAAQEFITMMVSYGKKNELEKDLLSNTPSDKTISFLALELRKAYPQVSLDSAANMIHDAIAEQIFNKRTSKGFMNFVKISIKGYWDMPSKSPILEFYQGSNLTPQELENLSGAL